MIMGHIGPSRLGTFLVVRVVRVSNCNEREASSPLSSSLDQLDLEGLSVALLPRKDRATKFICMKVDTFTTVTIVSSGTR